MVPRLACRGGGTSRGVAREGSDSPSFSSFWSAWSWCWAGRGRSSPDWTGEMRSLVSSAVPPARREERRGKVLVKLTNPLGTVVASWQAYTRRVYGTHSQRDRGREDQREGNNVQRWYQLTQFNTTPSKEWLAALCLRFSLHCYTGAWNAQFTRNTTAHILDQSDLATQQQY